MSVIEDKIKRNKSYFDQKEPEPGHKDRFLYKLDQSELRSTEFHFGQVYKIAAVFLFIVVAGFILIYVLNGDQKSNEAIVNSIVYSQDLNDVLAYYDAVSLKKVDEIDNLVNDPEKAAEIKQTAIQRLNDIDGSLASIEKELSKNPENENVKATLINIKKKKMKVMDDILTQLDFANTSLF